MRRITVAIAVALAVLNAGCANPESASQRIVRVDFQQDEFASHFWRFFPQTVHARPGDEVVFRQEWTGEPHTVTFGTIVDDVVPKIDALETKFADLDETDEEAVADAEAEYARTAGELPSFDPYQDVASKAASQPCYLESGRPPADPDEACREREQPAFDGRHAYYSSGFIAPEGSRGNVFRMPVSDDTPTGTYRFYCVVHFPQMQGRLIVLPKGRELPSTQEVNRRARDEIEEVASPLRKAFTQARRGDVTYQGDDLEPPLAGYHAGDEFTVAIDEFVPKTWRARANEPITWTIIGAHTISFDVPEYLPIYTVLADGTVQRNPKVDRAAGGSPKAPPVDFTRHRLDIDGGTWDGSGFISSGLLGSEPYSTYTLRISKPGRYRYACLVHPKMVGTLIVS